MTLYLKYRPQQVSELDLTSVREAMTKYLESFFKDGNLPHAWLFSGPRGLGKTSAARILAKAINCQGPGGKDTKAKGDFEPCNECEMCIAVTSGAAVDIMEIDAASNRGIDDIRELREKVRLAPMKAKYKVYIIDEVHMLTSEAANALLKTLEEPPGNTIFVLCTTEPDRLPETVISRCTRISFKKATLEDIVSKLERVAKAEKIEADKQALEILAKAGDRSFRDAIKLLEQAGLQSGKLDKAGAEKVLGMNTQLSADRFLELVDAGDAQKALEFVGQMVEEGINLRRFIERGVELLRERLLDDISNGRILGLIEGLEKAYERTKTTAVPQLPLEIFIIENSKTQASKPAEVIVEKKTEKTQKTESAKPSEEVKYELGEMQDKWAEVMKAVRPKNHSVEALLRSTKPLGFDGRSLTLEVFYKFHKDKLESEKCRRIVEVAVGEVMGVDGVKLFFKLGEKPARTSKVENITAEGVDEDIIKAAEDIFKAEAV